MKRQIKRVIAGVLAVATLFLATPISNISTNPLALKSAYTVSAETYGDLTYEIVDEKISITGCDESATDVVIPSEIDGLPVTSISSLAFSWCKELTSIKIPGSVTSIGGQAFFLCESLTEIAVDEDNQYFCDIDGVLFNKDKTTIIAYPLGKTSIEYEIPDSVTRIGKDAFAQHLSLTSVTIPDSVTSIEEGAFMNCLNLNSIAIPNLVFNIGYLAFWGCYGLTSIMVGEDNQYYSDIDGVLFSKDETTLIQYPSSNPLELYDVSDSVTSIGYSAFSHCSNLTSITVPNSVTSIGGLAFSYCSSLTSITIPDSVTSIGAEAFRGCTSLTSITIPDSVTSIGDRAFDSYIYGYTGSYAETYANENEITFIALDGEFAMSDLNADGVVDSTDITFIKQAIYGRQTLPPNQAKAADINGDGKLDVFDLVLLKRNILK